MLAHDISIFISKHSLLTFQVQKKGFDYNCKGLVHSLRRGFSDQTFENIGLGILKPSVTSFNNDPFSTFVLRP